jgi:hypothetical protein
MSSLLGIGDDFGSASGMLRKSKFLSRGSLFCNFVCWIAMQSTLRSSIDLSASLL